jgi:hypothetical protein
VGSKRFTAWGELPNGFRGWLRWIGRVTLLPWIAGVAAVLLVVVVYLAGSHHASAAKLRHHYFLVGKHECARQVAKLEAKATQNGQLLAVRVAIDTRKFPVEYRQAAVAGCEAAQG